MKRVVELAPAKLNLYLKVLKERTDGYHDIVTLFERIDIFDKITVSSIKEGIKIECNEPIVPTSEGSLCCRAVELMKQKYKIKSGVKVSIEKKIPVASGLGGGSSDAASILKTLNRLWNLKLKSKELIETARALGADIPFFLSNTSYAIGRGRGDHIEPIKVKKSYWHVVISPNIILLSGEIYKLYSEVFSLTLTSKMSIDKILSPSSYINNINRLKTILHNDLERIVLSREPLIKDIKNILKTSNGDNTLVSGSGPSVFGLYQTRKEALRAKERCVKRFPESRGWCLFITKTF